MRKRNDIPQRHRGTEGAITKEFISMKTFIKSLLPSFAKGRHSYSPLWQRGVRGDFMVNVLLPMYLLINIFFKERKILFFSINSVSSVAENRVL